MDLGKVGTVVAESLALQGRLEAIAQEKQIMDSEIDSLGKEIKRLESLKENRSNLETKAKELKREQSDVMEELNKRLEILSKDGVVLPLGRAKATGATRL